MDIHEAIFDSIENIFSKYAFRVDLAFLAFFDILLIFSGYKCNTIVNISVPKKLTTVNKVRP